MYDIAKKSSCTVGVVLVNWNSDEYTVACIESLLNGSRVPDSVVVVDNASMPGSVERIVKAHPSVYVIRNPYNYGFTGANNIGLKYLLENNIEYAWILNNDTIVADDCLESMLCLMGKNDKVSAVTGKMYYYDSDKLLWFAGSNFNKYTFVISHRGQGEIDSDKYNQTETINFFDGCSLLIRSYVLKEVGLFDELYFAYNEDIDLSFRLRQHGYIIYFLPKAVIWHKVSSSITLNTQLSGGSTTAPLQHFLSCRNRIYIIRRYGNILQKLVGISTAIFSVIIFTLSLLYFNRNKKVHAAWLGLYRGLTDDISSIRTKLNTIPYN